jgi:DNA-binding NarL/FixJ family response regulator
MKAVIRVGIVEDHPLLQRGLIELISEAGDIVVVWTAATIPEMQVILRTGAERADIVLVDRSLPGGGPQNADAVAAVVGEGSRALVLSRTRTRSAVTSALATGAHGYLSKNAAETEVVAALRAVAAGEIYISSDISIEDRGSADGRLSVRERDLVQLLARGLSDAAIAHAMHIEITTVRTHLDRIQKKAGARKRWMIVRWAIDNGQISPDEDSDTLR